MRHKLAFLIYEHAHVAITGICGVISPKWFHREMAFRVQVMRDHLEMEDIRDADGPYICDACNPENKPN